jgi:hypothetical protein
MNIDEMFPLIHLHCVLCRAHSIFVHADGAEVVHRIGQPEGSVVECKGSKVAFLVHHGQVSLCFQAVVGVAGCLHHSGHVCLIRCITVFGEAMAGMASAPS